MSVLRSRSNSAKFGFWSTAIAVNILYVACCVAPDLYFILPLFLAWLFIFAPTVGGFGAAWARLATREDAVPRRTPPTAWAAVIILSVMPLITLCTFWPLHLAFLIFRADLDRLADRVAAGHAVSFPKWVGPFRVARTEVDPDSGNVGLMIDPNPNGPTGFVRVHPGVPPNPSGPFGWDDLHVDLGWGWDYREED